MSERAPAKVLLASYGGGHANMLLPVYRELQKNSNLDVSVMAFTGARFTYEKAGLPFFSFKDTAEYKSSERAAQLGARFAGETSGLLPLEETIAYMGCSMADLMETHGEAQALDLFHQNGRNAFLPVRFFKSLLQREKYDLVITTNSPRSEKALVFAARDLGIPTVVIVDLFDRREFKDRTAHPGYGDKICVLNDYVRDEMVSLGRPREEIVVTGNPAFDKLANPNLKSLAQQLRKERGWDGKKIVLWARGNDAESLELNSSVETRLNDFSLQNPNTVLVIRPHPNENLEALQFPSSAFISTRLDPLPPLLEASDLVITMLSTVGLEAALIGKPLIQLRMTEHSYASPYVELGLATPALNLDELIHEAQKILMSEASSRPPDWASRVGSAARSVAQVALDLLRFPV